jgi:hypothetical protein
MPTPPSGRPVSGLPSRAFTPAFCPLPSAFSFS